MDKQKQQHGSETILVVDDDEMLLHLIRIVFERKGYSVLTARNGNEAIDVYSKHKDEVGLVLSDMGLPTLRGQETYKNLKKINPDVKMILGSTYWSSHVRESLKAMGAYAFYLKAVAAGKIVKKASAVW